MVVCDSPETECAKPLIPEALIIAVNTVRGPKNSEVATMNDANDRHDPIPFALLPDTAEVADSGHLHIGGCDVEDLAAEFGTPLFIYDEEHLRARCREAVLAFGDGVAYAGKAFLCLAMARLVYEEGMLLDVASGGELHTAIRAEVPGDRIVLHGNNKSLSELTLARQHGVAVW